MMLSARKWRMFLVAVATLLVVSVLYSKRERYEAPKTPVAVPEAANGKGGKSLIESTNNDKVDAAINNEISKHKDGESSGTKANKEEVAADDFDPAKEFLEIRSIAPMTVFSKTYCPYSQRLKQLLRDNYSITPEPIIVELDKHKHGKELQEYLKTITDRSTVPNVLVGTKSHTSRGGSDDFLSLHSENKLADMLNTWGDKELSAKRIEAPSNV